MYQPVLKLSRAVDR